MYKVFRPQYCCRAEHRKGASCTVHSSSMAGRCLTNIRKIHKDKRKVFALRKFPISCLLLTLLSPLISVINLSKFIPAPLAPPLLAPVQTQTVSTTVVCFTYFTSPCSLLMFTLHMPAEPAIFLATTTFHLCNTYGHASRIMHHASRVTHYTSNVKHPTSHIPHQPPHATRHMTHVTHHSSHLQHRHCLPGNSCSFAATSLCSSYRPQRLGSTPPLPAKATAAAVADDDVADDAAAAAAPVQCCHTSHISHHTSHITRHTPHVPRHTSLNKHHTPHATTTRPTSSITHPHHISHLKRHTSHLHPKFNTATVYLRFHAPLQRHAFAHPTNRSAWFRRRRRPQRRPLRHRFYAPPQRRASSHPPDRSVLKRRASSHHPGRSVLNMQKTPIHVILTHPTNL